jgi:spore coat protein CotH
MKTTLTTVLGCLIALFLSAQDPGDAFFSSWTVHEIRFQFSQPGFWDSLTQNYPLDQYMRADVSIDGMVFPESGVKYKGNSSYNNPSQKKPFRVDLEEYAGNQEFDGLSKFVLNNGFKDPSFLREKLMLDFLNAHGISAPRCAYARLYVNDQYRGLYTLIEDIGKTFVKDRFGNKNGNLFKGDPKGSMVWKGWDQNMYTPDYELKTNETANDWSDLIRFLNALNNTPNAQMADSLSKYLNVDAWLDYWAAHNLFVNLDSYVGSGHNYYLYHNTDTDRFEWITWDVNEAFGNFQMGLSLSALKNLPLGHIPMPANARPMMTRLWNIPAYRQALAEHACVLLEDFSNEKMDARIDSLADLIRESVYADNFKFYTNQQFEQNLSQDLNINGGPGLSGIAGIKPFISARRSSLLQQLAAYGCALSTTDTPLAPAVSIQLSPNPASDLLDIRVTGDRLQYLVLRDLQGRVVQGWQGDSETVLHWPLSAPAGVYLLELGGARFRRLEKVILGR